MILIQEGELMNFETLEEIKVYCEKQFPQTHTLKYNDSQIGQTQLPPSRTYSFILTALPPETGLEQAREIAKLKEHLDSLGFKSTTNAGKIEQGGYHIELSVKDKRNQLYALGQPVGFRLDPMGPATRFRVLTCTWDKQAKQFIYQIESEDKKSGAKTVSESSLSKI
jgi:hypothetical protein